MNEKALSDDSNTAYKMIDCIHFAKLSLYSVNTAPVCKICRLSRTVKKQQNDVRIFILDQFLLYMRGVVIMLDSLFL